MPGAAAQRVARGGISRRKLILGVILAGSVLCFFLILFAGAIAILREAAPTGHSGVTPLLLAAKRAIIHHIFHIAHHHK